MSIIKTEELQKIVELANSVPEEYRQKCFELLLSNTLQTKQQDAPILPVMKTISDSPTPPKNQQSFILPMDVKAFLSQYGLAESELWKYFFKDGQEIRPIYQLIVVKKATAQIQHALLMSLENAIINGQFQVEIAALRSRCIEQKCYDASNFTRNINSNAKFFKPVANDQPLVLSPDGKSELAELLESLQK